MSTDTTPAAEGNVLLRDIAEEFASETTGATAEMLVREVRAAAIEVIGGLALLQYNEEFDWNGEDGVYHLGHSGWLFWQLRGVWIGYEQPECRVDADQIKDIVKGIDNSRFRIYGVRERLLGRQANSSGGGSKVLVNYSITLRQDARELPLQVYNQHRALLKAATLKNISRTYWRETARGQTQPWHAIYQQEYLNSQARTAQLPGPDAPAPMFGGAGDHSGTHSGGGGGGGYY